MIIFLWPQHRTRIGPGEPPPLQGQSALRSEVTLTLLLPVLAALSLTTALALTNWVRVGYNFTFMFYQNTHEGLNMIIFQYGPNREPVHILLFNREPVHTLLLLWFGCDSWFRDPKTRKRSSKLSLPRSPFIGGCLRFTLLGLGFRV